MTTTTAYQDALARIMAPKPDVAHIPPRPSLSNEWDPTTADLLLLARYMEEIANGCSVHARYDEPNNPFATIGALRALTWDMARKLASRLADEERNLLLMDRLRAEEQQMSAHERLMAEDGEYAAEFAGGAP